MYFCIPINGEGNTIPKRGSKVRRSARTLRYTSGRSGSRRSSVRMLQDPCRNVDFPAAGTPNLPVRIAVFGQHNTPSPCKVMRARALRVRYQPDGSDRDRGIGWGFEPDQRLVASFHRASSLRASFASPRATPNPHQARARVGRKRHQGGVCA